MVGKVLQGWCGSGGNVRLSHLVMSFLLLFREHHVVNAAMLLRSHFCPSVCLSLSVCLYVTRRRYNGRQIRTRLQSIECCHFQ